MASPTQIKPSTIFVTWVFMVSTVQQRIIVIKFNAGQKIHISIFAIVVDAVLGKIPLLLAKNPTMIQRNSVSIGESVARKIAIVAYPPNGVPKSATISAYIKGIEMTQRVCEIIAIDAPVSGFPP